MIVLVAVLLPSSLMQGQPGPAIEWQKCLGGSNDDVLRSVKPTTDGGFILAGHTLSNDGDVSGNHGNADYWVVKLDGLGALQWQVALGGSDEDKASGVVQTTDGGYLICGNTKSDDGDVTGFHGGDDVWVVKLSATGSLLWQRTFGGGYTDWSSDLHITADGGCVVVGRSNSIDGDVVGGHGGFDLWLIKLDASGTLQWQKPLGGSGSDTGASVDVASDGGFVAVGTTNSADGDVVGFLGVWDQWVVRTDPNGNVLWANTYGGSDEDHATGVTFTNDGGCIVAGYSRSNDFDVSGNQGGWDAWVVQLDALGDLQWQTAIGGVYTDLALALAPCLDGQVVVVGTTASFGINGLEDLWAVKVDAAGVSPWQQPLGGQDYEDGYAVAVTADNGFILGGSTASNDGDVSGNHGQDDFWVVKLAADGTGLTETGIPQLTCAPNPTNGWATLTLEAAITGHVEVSDALGSIVHRQALVGKTCALDLSNLRAGVYMLTVQAPKGVVVQRLVKE